MTTLGEALWIKSSRVGIACYHCNLSRPHNQNFGRVPTGPINRVILDKPTAWLGGHDPQWIAWTFIELVAYTTSGWRSDPCPHVVEVLSILRSPLWMISPPYNEALRGHCLCLQYSLGCAQGLQMTNKCCCSHLRSQHWSTSPGFATITCSIGCMTETCRWLPVINRD